MPKVTLIVPVYNVQRWLRPCVNSIMRQTFEDWHLILVDDGSTDSSPKLCDYFASLSPRITVIHKPNGGPSSARNAGLDAATGDFIYFADADDQVHPELLSLLLNEQEATDADICTAANVNVEQYEFKPVTFGKYEVFTPTKAIEQTLYQTGKLWCSACNMLYRRSLFDNLRFTEGTRYEDLDFFYKIFERANKIAYTNQVTYHYRANPESYINTWSAGRLDVLNVVDKLADYMAEHGTPDLQTAAADRRFSAYYNIFTLATANNEQAVADRCWAVIKQRRISELLNPHVRPKNKLGALVALFGRKFTELIIKIL